MPGRTTLKPRKEPKQERSRQMREDILAASIRVLRREGPLRFTTLRVADAAGISVGSLYQYFPNKQALLFAIHSTSVERTWIEVQEILDHRLWNAREKIRRLALLFFHTESKSVYEMGPAFQDIEIFFANQPAHRTLNEQMLMQLARFIGEAIPVRSAPLDVQFSAQLLMVMFECVGKAVAGMKLSKRGIDRWAGGCADMVSNYLNLM